MESQKRILFTRDQVEMLVNDAVREATKAIEERQNNIIAMVQRVESEPSEYLQLSKLQARIKKDKRRNDEIVAHVMKLKQSKNDLGEKLKLIAVAPSGDRAKLDGLWDQERPIKKEPGSPKGIKLEEMMKADLGPPALKRVKTDKLPPRDGSRSPSPSTKPTIKQEPGSPVKIRSFKEESLGKGLGLLMSSGRTSTLSPADSMGSSTATIGSIATPPPSATPPIKPPTPAPGSARSQSTVKGTIAINQKLPPLPDLPGVPASLPLEATSYDMPARVNVKLTYDDSNLQIGWDALESSTNPPPMENYRLYISAEKPTGSGLYPAWKLKGELPAAKMPMAVQMPIPKQMARRSLCFAVVGKDKFGRYGNYSDIKHIMLPE